jgi:hypothetical protein
MKFLFFVLAIFLHITPLCFSDLNSTQGTIEFDLNSNGSADAILNSTGLGIGTAPSAKLHIQGDSLIEGSLSIGSTTGSSNLNLNGSQSYSIQKVSSNTQLGNHSIVLADTSSDNIILNLPQAANSEGNFFHIKKISPASQLWIHSDDPIENFEAGFELTTSNRGSLPYIKLFSNGSNWYTTNQSQGVFKVFAVDHLIAWLKFDDLNGNTAVESSIYSHNTTLRNGLNFSDSGVAGRFNRALDFEGSNNISAQIEDETISTPSAFTISAWVYPTSNSNGQIVRKNNEFLFRLNSNGTLLARIFTGGSWSPSTNSTGTYSISKWNHLAMRWDGTKIEYFINGQLDSTSITVSGPIVDTGNLLDVGGWNASFALAGKMDEFRVYNRNLEDSEVMALADQNP